MGHNTTVVAGATAGGAFTGTDPKTFFANADDATVDAAAIAAFLDASTGVFVDTRQSGSQPGDLTVSTAINKTAGGNATLTLTADHDIVVNQQIVATAGALTLHLTTNGINAAGGVIAINAALASNGGFITLTNNRADNGGIAFNADVNAGSSTLTLNSLNAPITQTAGTITAGTLTVGLSHALVLNQATNAIGNLGSIFASENIDLVDGSGGLTITGSVHANTQQVSINTTGDLVTSGSGTVFGATGISLTATGAMTIGAALSTPQPINPIQLSAGAGVTLNGAAADVSGSLTVNADSNADGVGTFTVNNAGISVSGDTIDITAADIALAGTLDAPDVTLRPSQNAATIGLGGGGSFALSAAELGVIAPNAFVTIGSAANTGGITIGSTEAVSAPSLNLALITGGTISVNATRGLSATDLVMTANSMALNGGTLAASGTVTLRPLTAGQLINLGGADAAGTLGLTNAELGTISSSALLQKIGSSTAGNISISSAISLNNDTVLETAGSITQTAAITGSLGMRAVNGITLTNAANDLGTVAAEVTGTTAGAGVTIVSVGHTTIGTVGDVSGISSGIGPVSVTAGAVTINAAITTTDFPGSTTITANGALGGSVGVFADVGNSDLTTGITAHDAIVGTGTIHGQFLTLSAGAGIGTDATGFVTTDAGHLSVDNTTTGNVAIVETDDVMLGAMFRNQAPSGTLSLRTLSGWLIANTVSTNNGQITFTADDTGAASPLMVVGGNLTSGGGAIRLFAADSIVLNGNVNAGSGNVTIEANSANAAESVADNFGGITGGGIVTGNAVTFKSVNGIGSTVTALKTAASTITATNTSFGDIVIVEADDASFSATTVPSGTIALTTTSGILTIGAATSAGIVTLAGADGINVNAAVTTTSTLALNSSGATAINVALNNLGQLQTDASGTTTISGGSVTTSTSQTYNDAVTLGAAATLTNTNTSTFFSGITFASTVNAAFDLAVSSIGPALFSGAVSGSGKLTLTGSGTTTLAADNVYTGATTVNAGTLLVNGSIVSATTVNGTATLGGTGHTGAVTVASGATLSPGVSGTFTPGPGILSTGDVNLSGGATLKIELGGTTAGSQYDQLNVTGSVTLSGALNLSLFNSFNPAPGNSFTLISNDGTDNVNGTFAGLAEGVAFNAAGKFFTINYHGGSNNNDVVLLLQTPPSITSDGGFTTGHVLVNENTPAVTTVTATDPDPGATLAYSIIGGADATKFQIDSVTGVLSFITAPDFEHPANADQNNLYQVQVRVSDGILFDDQALAVHVLNVSDSTTPIITSDGGGPFAFLAVTENTTAVTIVKATDPDPGTTLAYSIVGGSDAAKFQIDSVTGTLSFITAPDFAHPTDTDHNNSYVVQVRASDGSLFDDQTLTVGINSVGASTPPSITSNGGGATASVSIAENTIVVTTVTATDPDPGTTLAYSIVGGPDASRFQIDGANGTLFFIAAPDFEHPTDADHNNSYIVQVRASDGSLFDDQTLTVGVNSVGANAPPSITSNGGGAAASVSIGENTTAVTTVTATDPDGGALAYSIAGGADASKFQINGVTGALSFIAAPDFEHPTDADHNNSYVVQVRASDGSLFDDQILNVGIANVLESPPGSNDFNGDRNSDILWRHADGSVAEWQMNGRQVIGNLGIASPGNEWKFQDTGDLGGDGISDVIWRHTTGQVVLWKMDGNQIVSNTSILEVSNQYHVQGVADFNGDGKSDVLFRHDSGQVVLWQMDGDKIAVNTAISTPSRQFHIEGVGDFNGDGKADVLLRHDNGQVVMWQMDGDRIAVNTVVANVSQDYHVQGVGDFNGDGKSDVVWRHDSGQIVLWQMDGNRIVSNTQILDVSNQYKIQDVRDYNGDGMSDILLRHDSGQVVMWQMNGDKIASNTAVATLGNEWTIQAHHFDLL